MPNIQVNLSPLHKFQWIVNLSPLHEFRQLCLHRVEGLKRRDSFYDRCVGWMNTYVTVEALRPIGWLEVCCLRLQRSLLPFLGFSQTARHILECALQLQILEFFLRVNVHSSGSPHKELISKIVSTFLCVNLCCGWLGTWTCNIFSPEGCYRLCNAERNWLAMVKSTGHELHSLAAVSQFHCRIGSKKKNWDLYPACLMEMGRICRPGTGRAVLLTQDRKCFAKVSNGRLPSGAHCNDFALCSWHLTAENIIWPEGFILLFRTVWQEVLSA